MWRSRARSRCADELAVSYAVRFVIVVRLFLHTRIPASGLSPVTTRAHLRNNNV